MMPKGLLLITLLVASLVTFLAGPAALAVSRPGDVLVAPARDPASLTSNKGAFGGPPGPRSFTTFESGPVRPLALSADGQYLYAANTPDNRLEVFAVHDLGLTHLRSVPVGLEPVALAVSPTGDEVWVVNHLSDSVSVVDIAADVPHVKSTLWVGDEPRDIVFAGSANNKRAFITTAHRGQNAPFDPQLDTPSVPRADVWVFAADDPEDGPVTILNLFGDTPRALAVNADGTRVYAAVFLSGNRTTTLPPPAGQPFPKAPPSASADGVTQPNTGLIVQFDGTNWVDELGQTWNNRMWFSLPDFDVFEINATANPPREIRSFASVGTVLFNMAVNPKTGAVYVSNTEALNMVRFAGEANRANTTVQGHLADHRITVIKDGLVNPRDLNKHLDYGAPVGSADDRAKSLSLPTDMVVSSDGATLYVTAFGSQKIAAIDIAALENNSFGADPERHAELSAGGPGGVVLDEGRARLYVLTRFDMGVSVVDTQNMTETSHVTMYNPEPASVTEGRPFLYDARLTSSRGNDSCATCHVFGNLDALAWDLGDPDGEVKDSPNDYHPSSIGQPVSRTFHPMKGPMTTQSMRGLPRHGPMHWRGDRTGTNPVGGETLEEAAFKEFNEAFIGLMAREEEISDADMQKFTDFALQIAYPPNPIRALDNSLNSVEAFGETLYRQGVIRGDNGNLEICVTCHIINEAAGIFGTTGTMAFNSQPGEKDFKIPHFRDQYQKVGMHGWSFSSPTFKGDQIRGYSYNHNGATSTTFILDDLRLPADQLAGLRAFLFAFPAESAPVLGQQVTVSQETASKSIARLDLLMAQGQVTAPIPECDLVASGFVDGVFRGWQMTRSGQFLPDDAVDVLNTEEMKSLAQAPGNRITFTCTPWGSGRRIGIDQDEDGLFDKIELAQGSNPADAESKEFVPAAGNWFNPARPGHGLDIQRSGDLLAITWYTYADDGTPTWYQTSGPLLNAKSGDKGTGGFVGELLRFSWNHQVGEAGFETAGSLALTFADKRHATLEWTLGTSSGSEPVEFFAFAEGDTIVDFTGMWFDGGEPGYGLSVASQGDTRAVVVFFYDAAGFARWALGSGDNGIESVVELLSFSGFCPGCDWVEPTTVPAGGIQFAFTAQTAGLVNLSADFPGLADSLWVREVPMTRLTTDATNF